MSDSACYIERLPPEISGMICCHINQEDVLNLRSVSKFWNNVATSFFPGNLSIVFLPESCQRLLDISRHPVISKRITSLCYEPNTLDEYVTQDEWESQIRDSSYTKVSEAVPGPGASDRELRAWRRNNTKIGKRPRHRYSKSYLEQAYKEYTRMYAEQKDLRSREYGIKELSDAMSRLPNLSEICMNHGWEFCQRARGVKNHFAAGLLNSEGDHCGIFFMRSLLLAVHEAGIALVILEIGSVDWKFLQQSDAILERMKSTMHHLTTLELVISTGMDENDVEIPACRKYLSNNNKLAEFLAAAPKLESLRINFDYNEPFGPAELSHIFGNRSWPCLACITLENIDAASDSLNRFFERHASTLMCVAMRNIRLLEATWVETLQKMNKVLNLESTYLGGDLLGEYPRQRWNIEPDTWAEDGDLRSQANRTRKAIQDFLVQGGSCPLIDEDAHPQCYE